MPAQSGRATRARVSETYGKLPLRFEVNQGQTDGQVRYLSRGRGYTLFLASTEAVLVLRRPPGEPSAGGHQAAVRAERPEKIDTAVVRIQLVGANPAQVVGIDELPGKSHYFIGNDPKKWRTHVPHYARVRYGGIYPGIDLVYYGNQQQLEYDFIVAPGVDPGVIKLAFEGTDKAEIDAQGDLILRTASGPIQLQKPRIYQEVGGVRQEIAGAYLLNPRSVPSNPKSPWVGFQVAVYDTGRPLIIDPVLDHSISFGGSGLDVARDIAADSLGNAYVTGLTLSIDFPATEGAFDTSCNGFCEPSGSSGFGDAFVTKLDPTGSVLIYSTYLGGDFDDHGMSIAVDAYGNAYVTGTTYSDDFPTTPGAFQTALGGVTDVFVTKLNATGSGLVYSTFLGGRGEDSNGGIAIDSEGNAYITGTADGNFPTTPGAFQPSCASCPAGPAAFVAKLNPTGSALVYSTYLGGSTSFAAGSSIAIDSEGNAYVTGTTKSTDFPTKNPILVANDLSCVYGCGFVTKLNPEGSTLVYSTYLYSTSSNSIAVDPSGNAYVGEGGLVTKLIPDGSAFAYLIAPDGGGYNITVDASGNAYATGSNSKSVVVKIVEKDIPADLSITMAGNVQAGSQATYTITITNHGPGEAGRVTLDEVLWRAISSFVSASSSQGSCHKEETWITCNLDTLHKGTSVTVKIVAVASSTLLNMAWVYSDAYDPDQSNNSAELDTYKFAYPLEVYISEPGRGKVIRACRRKPDFAGLTTVYLDLRGVKHSIW